MKSRETSGGTVQEGRRLQRERGRNPRIYLRDDENMRIRTVCRRGFGRGRGYKCGCDLVDASRHFDCDDLDPGLRSLPWPLSRQQALASTLGYVLPEGSGNDFGRGRLSNPD